MRRTLGLDLGTASIGWAVLDVPERADEVGAVLGMGSRIFSAGAEEKGASVSTKAKERRVKRSQRRQIARRSRRRRLIRTELCRIGLLPETDAEFSRLMDVDPNLLRRRSTEGEALTLREIGRVVYWMSSRRGFLSLRTGGSQILDDDTDSETVKRYRLTQFSPSTGAAVVTGQEDDLIGFVREQQRHHAGLLGDEVLFGRRGRLSYPVRPIKQTDFLSGGTVLEEFGLHGLVFFQRSVYWSEDSIGTCSAEPESKQQRAPKALRLSQQFRLWQTAVNLRVGRDRRPLSPEERARLVKELNSKKSLAFSKVRRLLELDDSEPINFERNEEVSLTGNEVDPEMARRLGDRWKGLDDDAKDRVVELLVGRGTEDQIASTLQKRFGFTVDEANAAMEATLPSGRMAYGRRAMSRVLPHLATVSSVRDALVAAGYQVPEEARQGQTVDIDRIPNPYARTTLLQLVKLVDALQRRFPREGMPSFDVVRIELSRDVSNNKKRRDEIARQQKTNQKDRAAAKDLVSEFAEGAENSSDLVRRFRLWREQKEQCLYSGRPIPAVLVGSNEVQMDHILPRAQTLDNSLGNLALVFSSENQDKGDRTIFEWGGTTKVDEVVARAEALGLRQGKINKLHREHVDPDVIPSSLLVTTGYINALARDVIAQHLSVPVEVSRGRLTRQLLYRLGLNKDIGDHRRHALDATMVALTTVSIAHRLAKDYKSYRDRGTERTDEFGGWEPWPGARDAIKDAHAQILVSHRVSAKPSGQLHEETNYGLVDNPLRPGAKLHARRKTITGGLSQKELEEIADPAVKQALVENLRRRGIDPSAAKLTFIADDPPILPDGQKIRKVRLHKSLPGNQVLRPNTDPKTTVTLSRNHAAYVYRNTKTGRYRIHVQTTFDAFKDRAVNPKVFRERFKKDGEEFLWSVRIGDTLRSLSELGEPQYWAVTSLDLANGRLYCRPLNASTGETLRVSAKTLREGEWNKVVVLPDGQIRRARD